MNRITLQEISELAGVSSATVSRVLNGYPHVRPEVRARVQQVIEDTGYRPNPAARSLAGQKSRILSLIIPETAQILFTDPFFSHLIQSMVTECQKHDYMLSLFLFNTPEHEEAKVSHSVLQNQMFDGVLLTAAQIGDPLVEQLLERNIPFVLVGYHENAQVNFVDADNITGAYAAVSHLIHVGYERIAMITGPTINLAAVHRREGYLKALRERGRLIDQNLIAIGDFTEASGYIKMRELLPHHPQAIFAASDMMALGALRALREAGRAVPEDIALIGYDDLPPARLATPQLTTVRQPIQLAGQLAVSTLIDILEHDLQSVQRTVLPTELIIRASCGAKQRW